MFAVFREGYEIYGVGETPEAARKDASEWLVEDREEAEGAEMIEHGPGVLGKVYIGRCTERLAVALQEDIRELVYDWNEDGLLDLLEGETVDE